MQTARKQNAVADTIRQRHRNDLGTLQDKTACYISTNQSKLSWNKWSKNYDERLHSTPYHYWDRM